MDENDHGNCRNTVTDQQPPKENNVKIFLKQLMVVSGVWTAYFLCGLCIGSPTVFIPQIRRDASFNTTIDQEMTSWLASAHTYSGVVGVVVLCFLASYIGRRVTFLIISLSSIAGFTMFYCSRSINQILVSEVTLGLLFGSQTTVSILVSTEYTSPKYRGVFLSLKVASFFWGVWVANAVGTFFHWRKIPVIGILCSLYITGTVLFWPESPYWLASKERYEACSVSHRWLKGHGDDAEKELSEIIVSRRGFIKKEKDKTTPQRNMIATIRRNENFFKPILLSVLLIALYVFSGKLVCSVYAIEIIKKMTSSEDAAYTGMLALDGLTVLSMYVGGGLSRIMKRRTLLLTSSSIAIILLLIISLYLYITYLGLITENKYVTLLLLSMFSIAISFGPVNMCTAIYGELVSLRHRCSSMLTIGILSNALIATVVKLSPLIFRTFKLHGAFLFYGVTSLICVILLYKYLPETKDKTLREIQDCLSGELVENKEEENKELM